MPLSSLTPAVCRDESARLRAIALAKQNLAHVAAQRGDEGIAEKLTAEAQRFSDAADIYDRAAVSLEFEGDHEQCSKPQS